MLFVPDGSLHYAEGLKTMNGCVDLCSLGGVQGVKEPFLAGASMMVDPGLNMHACDEMI